MIFNSRKKKIDEYHQQLSDNAHDIKSLFNLLNRMTVINDNLVDLNEGLVETNEKYMALIDELLTTIKCQDDEITILQNDIKDLTDRLLLISVDVGNNEKAIVELEEKLLTDGK